jgi:hypothetical protein
MAMTSTLRRRALGNARGLAFGALCAAASLSLAGAQDRPSGGTVLPHEVVAAASAYQTYMAHAADVKADYRDGEGVHQRLRTGVAYEESQFEEGMIGYGALVALQDARFTSAVVRASRSDEERHALAQRILANPSEVMQFEDAPEAARLVAASLSRQARDVSNAGKAVKQSAYDIQHDAWSKGRIANLQGRVREVKTLSATHFNATDADNARLMKAMLQLPAPEMASTPASPVILRSLALAALAKLGEAGDADLHGLAPILTEYYSADCLHMAKLNLYQCMAVAEPHYENVFCLGQHALSDTGQCVASAVTASPTRFAPPYRVAASTAPIPVRPAPSPARRHGRRH